MMNEICDELVMQKLTKLENAISKLSDAEYSAFRQWFSEYENERWLLKWKRYAFKKN